MDMPPVLLSSVELALNQWLSLDPESATALEKLADSTLCLHITGLQTRLYLLPDRQRITVLGNYEGEADATIHASPANLLKMGLSRDAASIILASDTRVEGDIGLATRFSELLKNVDIDWEELLSRLVGDIVAHGAGNALRSTTGWLKDSAVAMRLNVGEYLNEESRATVPEAELASYIEQVDELRHAAERIDARIRRLQQTLDADDDKA